MRKMFVLSGMGLLALFIIGSALAGVDLQRANSYSVNANAASLSPETLDYIRPGLTLKIVSFTIPSDTLKPVVVYSITDEKNQPLDMDGIITPGAVAPRFVLARIKQGDAQYTAYTVRTQTSPITKKSEVQASTDSGGSTVKLGDGTYQYTFGTKLPADYPRNVTHTLGIHAARNLTAWGFKTVYTSNILYSYVPNGDKVTTVRDVSRTEVCNQCHDGMGFHDSSARRELLYCNLCHQPQSVDPDTGNSVDMSVMVHKIHMGSSLPSVIAGKPYQIIGNGQSVNDYSKVGFPYMPEGVLNCTACHQKGTQADNWFMRPTRAACGSCHDDVDFAAGKNHLAMDTDDYCAMCHQPGGDKEYDLSVKGAHTIAMKSKQLNNPKIQIITVNNFKAGQRPEIVFKITDKKGKFIPLSKMYRVRLTVDGPSTDFAFSQQDSQTQIVPAAVFDFFTMSYSYQLSKPLPVDAKGTYLIAMEGRQNTKINVGTPKETTAEDRVETVFKYVSVDGSAIVERRKIVSDEKCNACHGNMTGHGTRRNVLYCAMCHKPDFTGGTPKESVNFAAMVHNVHASKEANRPYFGINIGYPGKLQDCQQCHLPNTYQLPLADGLQLVATPAGYFNPSPASVAACLSCHDDPATAEDTAAHAYVMLAPKVDSKGNFAGYSESCSVCHGVGKEFALDTVHAKR